jgi:hypothetical protein
VFRQPELKLISEQKDEDLFVSQHNSKPYMLAVRASHLMNLFWAKLEVM